MRLPRWLVILMLTTSVLSVLAAVDWWWVTWPGRTARQFVGLAGVGDVGPASRLFRKPDGAPLTEVEQPSGKFQIFRCQERKAG